MFLFLFLLASRAVLTHVGHVVVRAVAEHHLVLGVALYDASRVGVLVVQGEGVLVREATVPLRHRHVQQLGVVFDFRHLVAETTRP